MGISPVAEIYPYAPYCGTPPDPTALTSRWNLDPWLLAALFAIVVAYALLMRSEARESRAMRPWRQLCFYLGWWIGAAALVSPLCALSVSLFSARVGQHMVLETIVAPLVALGTPRPPSGMRPHPLAAAGAFAALLWFWHAPSPYTATFQSAWIYWLMHITAFGAAFWLWRGIIDGPGERIGLFLLATLATTLQMGFLGALFTLAARPLFRVHAFTTASWGLTPLQDQQLGGVLMWIPAGAIFLAAIVVGVAIAIGGAEARARVRSMAAARA
jgi:putative membrane protein